MQQSSLTLSELYRRQLVRRIFPIIGTCGLVYWLTGGIPPIASIQFIQVYSRFSILWVNEGAGALWLAVLSTVQILCVGLAWGVLLWLIVREVRVLRAKDGLLSLAIQNASGVAGLASEACEVPLQVAAVVTPPSALSQSGISATEMSSPSVAPAISDLSQPDNEQEFLLENPFEQDLSSTSEVEESTFVSRSLPVSLSTLQNVAACHEDDNIYQPDNSFERDELPQSPAQLYAVEQPASSPFDVRLDILELFDVVPSVLTTLPPSLPRVASTCDNPLENLSDEFLSRESLSEAASDVPTTQINTYQSEPMEPEEDDDPFIYGNPFSGPLPEVFRQDHDLRRAIIEQTGEAIEPPIEQVRPKKKRVEKRPPSVHTKLRSKA